MSEVLPGVAAYVFDHLAGTRLAAWCYADNVASARTLEKAGFAFKRRRRQTRAGVETVCLDYELLAGSLDTGGIRGSNA